MIPTRVTAQNFLSYASLDLNLSGLGAACIAGPNGSGKSSLVDALLFAWFGAGRYRLLDQYVRLGTDQMSVGLEWHTGDQRYRVLRRRSIAGRSKSEADLHVCAIEPERLRLQELAGQRPETEARLAAAVESQAHAATEQETCQQRLAAVRDALAALHTHAHRLRVALANAAAAGDISREDRRTRYQHTDGLMTLDIIAHLFAGGLIGLVAAYVILWWMM